MNVDTEVIWRKGDIDMPDNVKHVVMTARSEVFVMDYIFMSSESNGGVRYDLNKVYMSFDEKLKGLKATDYGKELDSIGIIMVCATQELLDSGFLAERRYISWKKRFADMRLQINHNDFVNTDTRGRQLLVAKNIVDSIRVVELKSKKRKTEFAGEKLISDILNLIGISLDDIYLYIPPTAVPQSTHQ